MELDDVCELIVDCEHKTAPTQEEGFPSIRTPNIGRGYLLLDGVNRVSEDTYKKWTARAIPQHGDIIMAREAPVGNVAMIPQGLKPCLGQRTLLMRPMRSMVDPRYLVYLLIGDEVQNMIHSMTNGVTVAHLNMKDVRSLQLPPLPPLNTQRKIATTLSAYDDLIENNKRRIKILEEMAQNLYREWFVKFRFPIYRSGGTIERFHNPETDPMQDSHLGPMPQDWTVTVLGDICEENRVSVSPNNFSKDTPYIGLEHMPRGSITLSEWGRLDDVISTKLLYKKGDILFGKIRPYFHKVGVALADGLCSSDVIVINPLNKIYFGQVLCCVSSDDFVAQAAKSSQGTKMPRANWNVMTQYPCPLPNDYLSSAFSEQISLLVNQCCSLALKNKNLQQTRDLLLPKLISGEIDIKSEETNK